MVVWGGATATFDTNTGGRYDPTTNTWTPTSTAGAPEARNAAAGVWSGSKVLIWGGGTYNGAFKVHRTGALYDPVADTWTPTTLTNAPSAREFFAYAWTGNTLIVWGGCTTDPTCLDSTYTGGQYTPSTNTWIATELVGGPSARGKTGGVWTGTELIAWGGETDDSGTFTFTGGGYTPVTKWCDAAGIGRWSIASIDVAYSTGLLAGVDSIEVGPDNALYFSDSYHIYELIPV
jgi:hypothetical protein